MAIPISTWALVAGVSASVVMIAMPDLRNDLQLPVAVIWLGIWASVFGIQVAWWTLFRKRA